MSLLDDLFPSTTEGEGIIIPLEFTPKTMNYLIGGLAVGAFLVGLLILILSRYVFKPAS